MLFDIVLISLAGIFSYISFAKIEGIGFGTLVSALVVGRTVNIFNSKLNKRYKDFLEN